MSYFAESAYEYITRNIESGNRVSARNLVMVPSLPSDITLELGRRLHSFSIEKNINFTFKVAKRLAEEWGALPEYQPLKDMQWLDESGNLTAYRNSAEGLVVLLGVDRVTDSSSLADFHLCSIDNIWKNQLEMSFSTWVSSRLDKALIAYENKTVENIDSILKSIKESGRGNLIKISKALEDMPFEADGIQDGNRAEKFFLKNLGVFGLPVFSGYNFNRNNRGRSFTTYIESAGRFFSYDLFLEEKSREKALTAIDNYRNMFNKKNLSLSSEDRGHYSNDEDFLNDLGEYIKTGDKNKIEILKSCNFIKIWDEILKFREQIERQVRDTVKKLSGGPVEVILTAIWHTLGDLKKEYAYYDFSKIIIRSSLFKHDYEGVSESSRRTTEDSRNEAIENLKLLVGGIDSLFNTENSGFLNIQFPETGMSVDIESLLFNDDIEYKYTSTAEPYLEFSITLDFNETRDRFIRKFAWSLPETQTYRIAQELFLWVYKGLDSLNNSSVLPVFNVQYYDELIMSKDDEELKRIMLHCARSEGDRVFNLITRSWNEQNDPLLPALRKLGKTYIDLVKKAQNEGLHSVFIAEGTGTGSIWEKLRKSYEEAAFELVSLKADNKMTQIAPMLMRAFLIIEEKNEETQGSWVAEDFEKSGVATILHPAVLEMLNAHIKYLFACFNYCVSQELTSGRTASFSIEKWLNFIDLAAIKMPVSGLICDENHVIDADVRGHELIHRIGKFSRKDASLSTRLLVRYEGFDDEDISDSEMFYETLESKLMQRILDDFVEMHPHARDGISIAIYRNDDIQPVISAVHNFLEKLKKKDILNEKRRKPYSISITFFTESGDEVGISKWIEQWKERWEASETEEKFLSYRLCRFSVAHRIVTPDDSYIQFRRMILDNMDADVVILSNFIGAGEKGSKFFKVEQYNTTGRTLNFPILEKAFCSMNDPRNAYKRFRVLSNRQFRVNALHSEIMVRIRDNNISSSDEYVLIGSGDYLPWKSVIDALHKKTEWVVCIDPSIDEKLLKSQGSNQQEIREIIGFGSGVGSHGESNYTISTEKFCLSDIAYRLEISIRSLFNAIDWNSEKSHAVSQSVLKEAQKLSGLSLLRATSVNDYHIHDFMSYALARKMLKSPDDCICDQLITLDAYRHWFDIARTTDEFFRPDLLWLTAKIDQSGCFEFNLKLIECKLGSEKAEYIEKAKKQIENGLINLVQAFMPKTEGLDDDRPDQRYWWLQLHRLIASKTEITAQEHEKTLNALEKLSDGVFSIHWSAAAFIFRTDDPCNHKIEDVAFEYDKAGISINYGIIQIGYDSIVDLCLSDEIPDFCWHEYNPDIELENDEEPIFDLSDGDIIDDDVFELTDEAEEEISDNSVTIETVINDSEKHTPASITSCLSEKIEEKKEAELVPQTKAPQEPVSITIPDRILLGNTSNGKNIYWEFGHKELNNRHLLVFGTSGMGKTYAIQCILCELAKAGQNSLIVDYTNGFLPHHLEKETKSFLSPKQHLIVQSPLPISPFKIQTQKIDENLIIPEKPVSASHRIASIFKKLYGTLGDQQYPVLMDAIIKGIGQYGEKLTLDQFQEILESFINDGKHDKSRVQSTLSKLTPFIMNKPFSNEAEGIGWSDLFCDKSNRSHIFQLAGVDSISSYLITEFVLWDLNSYLRGTGSENEPKVIVLDEVQNLDLTEQGPVAKYLTEGRKFGISLILATQTMSNLKGDKLSRLFQADHKLFFKPSVNELQDHARLLQESAGDTVPQWVERLSGLNKGECYSLGYSLNTRTGHLEQVAPKIKITSIKDRGFNV